MNTGRVKPGRCFYYKGCKFCEGSAQSKSFVCYNLQCSEEGFARLLIVSIAKDQHPLFKLPHGVKKFPAAFLRDPAGENHILRPILMGTAILDFQVRKSSFLQQSDRLPLSSFHNDNILPKPIAWEARSQASAIKDRIRIIARRI